MKLTLTNALIIGLATLNTTAHAQIQVEIPIDFDPPCVFQNAQPLQLAHYLSPANNAVFLDGNAVVLNTCAGFNVAGISPPNFMAWNCNANNEDGSVPSTPEVLMFSVPVSIVSVRVGSDTDAGEEAALVALDAALNVVAADTVVLSNTMQTLTTVWPETLFAVLLGPCVMVADDLTSVIEVPEFAAVESANDGVDSPRTPKGSAVYDEDQIRRLVREALEKHKQRTENRKRVEKTNRRD